MTKPLFIALLAAMTATGCTKLPLASKAQAPEVERVVHVAAKPKARQAAVAEFGQVDPTRISHDIPKPTIGLDAEAAPADITRAADPNATLELMAGPTRQFRAFPVFASQDDVTGVEFSPAATKASWRLSPHGVPTVTKVKVTILDADGKEAASGELAPKDVGLTPRIGADQVVAVAPGTTPVLDYLKKTPHAERLTVHLAFEGPEGQPVLDGQHQPLALDLPMQVL